jgi:calcineurin-like phosphoesterase family protein
MKPSRNNLFFWSDPHFYHKPVIDFCERPFTDLTAMHEAFISNYNRVVEPNDTCIWVGDCFFCGSQKALEIMSRLNGKKILVTGNHDSNRQTMLNSGFDFVCEKLILKIAEQEVLISHYPYKYSKWYNFFSKTILRRKMPRYMDRRPENNGGWLIHGHTHEPSKLQGKMIHVGVDAWDFTPVSVSTIESIILTRKLSNGKTFDY